MIERSAGVLVYRDTPRKYLLLRRKKTLDFPKGKLEKGESVQQAALRETLEESGLRVELEKGFRRTIHYKYSREKLSIDKSVTFFLAKSSRDKRVKISQEHSGFAWLSPEQAEKQLRHKNAKWLIREAERYLKRCGRQDSNLRRHEAISS